MNFTTYFIKHPVISIILNCMIVLIGLLCFKTTPIREYPNVVVPKISVYINYPNADASLVESSVTNVVEDRLSSITGLNTITSSSSQGLSKIALRFREGTNIDHVLIEIRDALGKAKSSLPKGVKDPIVKRSTEDNGPPFMAISISSSNLELGDLSHYVRLNVKNLMKSLKGVSDIGVWGPYYTYKVVLDPEKMYSFGVNPDEIYEAIEKGNNNYPVGRFQNEIQVTLDSKLKSIEDFENLIIKENKQNPVLLKYVAKVSFLKDEGDVRVKVNGKSAIVLSIERASDANPLKVSDLVRQQISSLNKNLPIKLNIIIDQAEFIRSSISNIKSSIVEAVILVLVIIFIFLRNVRSTIIPAITIPISLIGSIIFLKLFGFSINIITLTAMVLAIGMVVDDAIVVLENISRHIENGLSPYQASIKGAQEIGFAVIAMTLSSICVYIPIVFSQGIVGQLFTEFAVAIGGSIVISGIVALTLSPLMSSYILKQSSNNLLPQLDKFFNALSYYYKKVLQKIMQYKNIVLLFALILVVIAVVIFKYIPHEVAPKEDRGLIGVFIPPVPGKDKDYLENKVQQFAQTLQNIPEAKDHLFFIGDWGMNFVFTLKHVSQRKRSASQIVESIFPQAMMLPSMNAWPWNWDCGLPGANEAMESRVLELVISSVDDYEKILKHINKVRDIIEDKNLFQSSYHNLKMNPKEYSLNLNKDLVHKMHLSDYQIARNIEIFFSGNRYLEFQYDGLTYPIIIENIYKPWGLSELYLTNQDGKKISLATFGTIIPTSSIAELYHYNQMRSIVLKADLGKDDNLEDKISQLLKIVNDNMPQSYKKTWKGLAKTYKESTDFMVILFVLVLVFIFAVLAIQFESFVDPLIIIVSVPLAALGALFSMFIFKQSINIYTQIGLITLAGIIIKHGILIVEFANTLIKTEKITILKAAKEACVLRLRPILMTAISTLFSAVPLVLSSDYGYETSTAIGVVLIGGIIFGTILTLFVLPNVYCIVKRFGEL